ncbi:MAG: winged helix-turn-helix domain-containing protein [Gammaproteobacteria bacterium]
MLENIGVVAGNIWQELNRNEELPISQISKIIKEKDTITYQGLGWLAREGKISYRSKGRQILVSLNEQ